MKTIDDLHRGFRDKYLSYQELTDQVTAWAEAFPDLVRLQSIGTTEQGRELWLLTLGPDPDRIRPAAWVDGNMHACELCGSSVALAIAEDVLRIHRGEPLSGHELAEHVREHLKGVLFYVLPRMSPDGAESVLTTGRWVRSNLRDDRPHRTTPRFTTQDLDGDGLALLMRQRHESGDFVEDPEIPGLMVPRRLEDPGPYYRVFPEGIIEGWDGFHIPTPNFVAEYPIDLNRNFPWSWAPEPEQVGAGPFPGSEPESRAVIEFTSAAPHIFSWLNLHTFGGVYIRPLGDQPDTKMEDEDLALFRQIEQWGDELTGYPTVSGFEEFTYEPDKPLRGDLAEYAYHQRGCIGYVCELWDLFARIGAKRPKRFVEHYTHLTLEDLRNLGRWDRDHNQSRVVRPWVPVEHSQLGAVEVGGIDPRVGMWNPPYELLPEICRSQAAMYLRVAALAPRLAMSGSTTATSGDVTRPGRGRGELRLPTHPHPRRRPEAPLERAVVGPDRDSGMRAPRAQPRRDRVGTPGRLGTGPVLGGAVPVLLPEPGQRLGPPHPARAQGSWHREDRDQLVPHRQHRAVLSGVSPYRICWAR